MAAGFLSSLWLSVRPLITNSTGKPLARLERLTGTSNLKLAKARYAQIRCGLEQDIQERSDSLPAATDAAQAKELSQFQIKRKLGETFAAVNKPPPALLHSGELEARRQAFEASVRAQSLSLNELKELIDFHRAVLKTLVERFIHDSGLPVTTAGCPSSRRKWAGHPKRAEATPFKPPYR